MIMGNAGKPKEINRPWEDSQVYIISFLALVIIVLINALDISGSLQTIPRVVLWIITFACIPGSIARTFSRRHFLKSSFGALVLTLLKINVAPLLVSDDVLYGYFHDAFSSMPNDLFGYSVVFTSSFLLIKVAAAVFETIILHHKEAMEEPGMRNVSTPGQVFAATTLLTGLALCGLWLTRYYPSGTSPDTWNQWQQIHGAIPLTDLHTPFHTLLMKLILQGWDNYAPVIFFQICAVSLVSGFLYSHIYQRGIRLSVIMLASITSSSALWCSTYMYPWKDTLYTVLLAVVFLVIVIENKHDFCMSYWKAGLIGLLFALVILLRYNGIICVLMTGSYFCVVLVRRKRFKQAAAIVLSCLIVLISCNALFYGPLGVKHQENGFSMQVFGAGIAAVSAQGGNIKEEELRKVDEFLGLDWIQSQYREWESVRLIWVRDNNDPEGYFQQPENFALNNSFVLGLGEHRQEIVLLYLSLFLRNPLIFMREIFRGTWLIWGNFGPYSNIFLLVIIALAAGFAIKVSRRKAVFSVMLPLIANVLSIGVSTITNESRYLQPTFLLFAPTVLYFLSLRSGES